MIFNNRIPKWFVFLMLPVIVLATLGTNYYLAQHSFFHFGGERELASIHDDIERINALKLRSIFERKLEPSDAEEINLLEQNINGGINQLDSGHFEANVTDRLRSSLLVSYSCSSRSRISSDCRCHFASCSVTQIACCSALST